MYHHRWYQTPSSESREGSSDALITHPVGKVVCVGRNYAEHAKELDNPIPDEPVLFIKPATSLADFAAPLEIPDQDCHYEAELAFLIGKQLTAVDQLAAKQGIAGMALALDLTKRGLQSKLKEKSLPWELAKSFDGACPITPFVPVEQSLDFTSLLYEFELEGDVVQRGDSAAMLNPVVALIAHISQHFTLMPGDIVLTGTPKGVGELKRGQSMTLSLNGHFSISSVTLK